MFNLKYLQQDEAQRLYDKGFILVNRANLQPSSTFKLLGIIFTTSTSRKKTYKFDNEYWLATSKSLYLKLFLIATRRTRVLNGTKHNRSNRRGR